MSDEIKVGGKRVSVLQLDQGNTMAYEWKLIIPLRSTLEKNFELLPTKFHELKLKFNTGFLKDVEHSIVFRIMSDLEFYVEVRIKNTEEVGFIICPSELQMMKGDTVKEALPIKKVNKASHDGEWQTSKYVIAPDEIWDDFIDALNLILIIQSEPVGKCINLPSVGERTSNDFEQFFLSGDLSDVILMAGDQEFPAHRVILSGRSSVFQRMFMNPMKETNEGIVTFEDIESDVLKELLHFIYTTEFSKDYLPDLLYVDLLKAADKYALQDLKCRCAQKIEETLTTENAIEICVLGDTYNEPDHMNTAIDIVKRNKEVALKDPNTARDLAVRCPKLAFELMIMKN